MLLQHLTYFDAIARAGGIPVGIPVLGDPAVPIALLASCDGLVLPGGPDVDPARYGMPLVDGCNVETVPANDLVELALVEQAVAADLPLLAICRGLQVLNVAFGGTLWQDLEVEGATELAHVAPHRPRGSPAHRVRVEPSTRLASLVQVEEMVVNSIHHQGIRRLGAGLVASGWSEDGLVEAIERPGSAFCVGVQWHPEELPRVAHAEALFAGLVHAAAARVAGPNERGTAHEAAR